MSIAETIMYEPPFYDRPPFDECCEWDRMVRIVRARDKMRNLFGLLGHEIVPIRGPNAKMVCREDPSKWVDL